MGEIRECQTFWPSVRGPWVEPQSAWFQWARGKFPEMIPFSHFSSRKQLCCNIVQTLPGLLPIFCFHCQKDSHQPKRTPKINLLLTLGNNVCMCLCAGEFCNLSWQFWQRLGNEASSLHDWWENPRRGFHGAKCCTGPDAVNAVFSDFSKHRAHREMAFLVRSRDRLGLCFLTYGTCYKQCFLFLLVNFHLY